MSAQNLSGQTLGQYELRELLGAGGMGTVYRAYQRSLARQVAFKVLAVSLAGDQDYIERFIHEAKISASLEHPHIVPIHDYGTYGDITFVVMRLLTGGSLAERLKARADTPASLGEAADLLKQLASALDYAHSLKVIHRDIKSNNIMFDNHGSAYLVDFGIAKLLEGVGPKTVSGAIVGTPTHIAPEQWRGEPPLPASDQYALGVVIYEMLTGRLPFEAPTHYGLMSKHLNEMPTPPQVFRADLPDAVTVVIERALAKDPEERFRTVTAFAQAFEGAIAGVEGHSTQLFNFKLPKPTPAQPPEKTDGPTVSPDATPSRRPLYRNPLLWVAGIVILLVLGGLFISQSGAGVSSTPTTVAVNGTVTEPSPTAASTQLAVETTPTPQTQAVAPTAEATEPAILSLTPNLTASIEAFLTQRAAETATATLWTATPTLTLSPTLEPTVDVALAVQTLDALRTATAFVGETATATLWTSTPTLTPNLTASIEAFLTQRAAETATATLWTATPTPTPVQPVTSNSQWIPIAQTFAGVDMVLVPPGCFQMGGNDEGDEIPINQQCFSEPFWIDRTEVTNAQFASLKGVAANPTAATDPQRPRDNITWFEARDFCALRATRLPTEAEWEYAARGPDDLKYPWGNDFVAENVVYTHNSHNQSADVGSKPGGASWVGALDLSGNAWEWVSSLYQRYPYNADDGREDSSNTTDTRALRGASWFDFDIDVRADNRMADEPSNPNGFRCARSYSGKETTSTAATPVAAAPTITTVTRNADWTPVIQSFDGVDMVLVPAGCFMMGNEDGPDDEKPVHHQCFDTPFWIDRLEVTNAQFAAFNGRAASPSIWTGENRPRENVNWFEARDFCEKRGVHLPTEKEWEYAARGPDSLVYPWGNDFHPFNVVYAGNSGGQTADVGSKPGGVSWVGALDMAGNVWEYTSSIFKPYPYTADDGRESSTDRLSLRLNHGGSWLYGDKDQRASFRGWNGPEGRFNEVGLRCARSYTGDETASTAATPVVAAPAITTVTHNADWTPVIQTFDGVEMVLVPPGCFIMGSENGDSDEKPVNQQCFDKPFWIDRTEVTNTQFALFNGVAASAGFFSGDNRPRETINWFEARDFCTMRGARLPNEKEWEYAARGPDNLVYPWGNDFNIFNLVYGGNSGEQTADVGSKPGGVSWVGAFDLSGNVWEWTASTIQPYPYKSDDGRESMTDTHSLRVSRGGSWLYYDKDVSASARGWDSPEGRFNESGFRCVRSYSDAEPSSTAVTPVVAAPAITTVTHNADWTPFIQSFDGVDMVLIPPGCFMMGSEIGDSDEKPVHQQCFTEPFWIDRTEVTNAQFAQFNGVAANQGNWTDLNSPRENITWFEARDFCAVRGGRLSTEREWEYAARGPDNLKYPWGDDFVADNAVYSGNSNNRTAGVGSKVGGVSWVGALDLSGNVWEWTATIYKDYPYDANDGREQDNNSLDVYHPLRGGSFYEYNDSELRTTFRNEDLTSHRYKEVGFRCARSYDG